MSRVYLRSLGVAHLSRWTTCSRMLDSMFLLVLGLQVYSCVVDLVFRLTNFVLQDCVSLLDTVLDFLLFSLSYLYNKNDKNDK